MDNEILGKLSSETIVTEAYERVKADVAALDPKALVQVNLENHGCCLDGLGRAARSEGALRPRSDPPH